MSRMAQRPCCAMRYCDLRAFDGAFFPLVPVVVPVQHARTRYCKHGAPRIPDEPWRRRWHEPPLNELRCAVEEDDSKEEAPDAKTAHGPRERRTEHSIHRVTSVQRNLAHDNAINAWGLNAVQCEYGENGIHDK